MAKAKKPKKPKPFRYDPEAMYAVMQHGGSSGELYLHTFDSEPDAEDCHKSCEKASYETEATDYIARTEVEQVGPLLFEMLRWLYETDFLEGIDGRLCLEIEALLTHARKTKELDAIEKITRAWWTGKMKQPFMGVGHYKKKEDTKC